MESDEISRPTPTAITGLPAPGAVTTSDNDASEQPHDEQKRLSAAFSAEQAGQRIERAF
jgi:hypothetical protein